MDIKELYRIYQQHPCVTTDSRDCPQGSLFIALKGASFDGNQFAQSALEKGCAYAIVDETKYYKSDDPRYILVPDCLTTFKELAREHRRQFAIPVVGITGTNGKTTTKELISAVLAARYKVMHTEGNYNNDVGVPKTLLRLRPEHEIAVIEMGASHPGDIRKLVEYVEPTCGMITNVGRAHLQGFGSFEGVKRTKGELYDFLRHYPFDPEDPQTKGLVFINDDDEDLKQMLRERPAGWTLSYGSKEKDGHVVGEFMECAPMLTFRWHAPSTQGATAEHPWHVVKTHLIGAYNMNNALAAITIGLRFGVPEDLISKALEDYVPTNNRSQLMHTAHNTLIVDAYNANPSSMAAALHNFKVMQADRKMVILGDMRELGDASAEEHQKVVDTLKSLPIDTVWLVGEEFGKTHCDFRKFKDVSQVKAAIAQEQPQGYTILVKGSNGIRLFELPELL